MAFQAAAIFYRVGRIIQDETNVRWPLTELVDWANDGLREIVLQKPNAKSSTVVIELEEGTYQQLPGSYMTLLRVVRNLKSASTSPREGGRVVRVVSRDILDSQRSYWHDTSITPSTKEVKHVTFDIADPKAFYVFPPNNGTGYVEAIVSVIPNPIPLASPDPEDITGYAVEVDIGDVYQNALMDYILYRAYSKDAQFAGNSARAAAHYQAFANSLQIKVSVEAIANPNITNRAEPPAGTAS